MIDTLITFVTSDRYQDENGVWRTGSPVTRQVLAQVDSVTRDEFFRGGQNGLKPEFRFTVFWSEYHGERECDYMGTLYSIYRTYREPGSDYLELYVERKAGVNNGLKTC